MDYTINTKNSVGVCQGDLLLVATQQLFAHLFNDKMS